MRLDDQDRSNVEDRRGHGRGLGGAGVRLGLGGTVVLLVLSMVFKTDLFALLGSDATAPGGSAGVPSPARLADEQELERVAVGSFNDVQEVWSSRLDGYEPAKLVLFWDATQSGCGYAEAQVGPFYCPADQRVYIDLGFYRELAQRFGAPGEFAQAYVIAHEVGHHLQSLMGIERKVRAAQQRDPAQRNALSVRMELQADCFAGAWGKAADARQLLDPGEIDQGLAAAAAVGDDRLQKAATGRVSPESFTHGTAEQRARWFRKGYDSGDPAACDALSAGDL